MAGNINISSESGDLICRNNGYAILQNTYYLSSWNANSSVYALKTDMLSARNGELCYLLNAGREGDKQAWYQTLNEDPHPVPDKSHLPVWYFEGSYYNESPDAIQSPMAKWHNGKWYDLSGRNIWGKPKQGIYIKDGRKIAITKTQHN